MEQDVAFAIPIFRNEGVRFRREHHEAASGAEDTGIENCLYLYREFSSEALRHLVAEMGVSQVVYGSDQPFPWPDTMDLIVGADFLDDSEKEAILGGNLRRLLRIEA